MPGEIERALVGNDAGHAGVRSFERQAAVSLPPCHEGTAATLKVVIK
jgi:hypothetical protein